jgi:hypothetical protein
MTEGLTLFYGMIIGSLFGFLLFKSRVFEPEVIIGQFQFRDWTMLKVFLTAIATGLFLYSILFSLGFERLMWKVTILHTDILGGLILGIGVAIAGACPGTVFAQIGAGYKDAIFTLSGGIAGSLIYPTLKPYIFNLFDPWPNEIITLDLLLNLPFWATALLLSSFIMVIILGFERIKK